MKKDLSLFSPIVGLLALEVLALGWAAQAEGGRLQDAMTGLSAMVAALILMTGILPAVIRPGPDHTLIACFAILFAFFIIIPFELSDLPPAQPGIPTYQMISAQLVFRMVNTAFLLPMAVHVSARFPRRSNMPARLIAAAYLLSSILFLIFLSSSVPWLRILMTVLLFIWFTIVIFFFLRSLLIVARDARAEALRDAQRARVMLFSLVLAEIPLWLRPLTLALGLDIFPYHLLLFFQLFIPLGIAYAVLKHDLFDIDRILRRTIVYGTVSLLLLTLYLALTTGIALLFADSLVSRPFAPLVSLFVAALLFEPTRKFIQSRLDGLLYPDRLKFQRAVLALQDSLARAKRREQIIRLLNDDFPAQIGAEWGVLKLFPEPDVAPLDRLPAWNTRLMAGSVNLGGYWLGPRRAGPVYDFDERNRLSALAGQAALALAYANAYESLYELNQNLETRVREQTRQTVADRESIAAFEERQKIARDLHDSVTQSLFGMHLMAHGLNVRSSLEMKDDLQALETQARDTLKEMRLLLDQLRNTTRGENVDLTEAVRGACEAFARRSGPEGGPLLSVMLESPQEIIIPKNIAQEALWVIRESLQNIVKHSGGRTARIELKKDVMLHISIRDDGNGFDATTPPAGHYGLRGMRERVLALGGELKIESELRRGTIVSFTLPLPRDI